jgi:hypothetical protein
VQAQISTISKSPSIDPRGLGRWRSWPFSCNPKHVTKIVVAYRPCATKTKGLKTVYQQHLRYIQSNGLQKDPVELFDHDLSKQIKEWQDAGERIVLAMDLNGPPQHNNLYSQLKDHRTGMEEFSHWGPKAPLTLILLANHQLTEHTSLQR